MAGESTAHHRTLPAPRCAAHTRDHPQASDRPLAGKTSGCSLSPIREQYGDECAAEHAKDSISADNWLTFSPHPAMSTRIVRCKRDLPPPLYRPLRTPQPPAGHQSKLGIDMGRGARCYEPLEGGDRGSRTCRRHNRRAWRDHREAFQNPHPGPPQRCFRRGYFVVPRPPPQSGSTVSMTSNKYPEILPHNGLVTLPLPPHGHAGVAPGKWLIGYLRVIPGVGPAHHGADKVA